MLRKYTTKALEGNFCHALTDGLFLSLMALQAWQVTKLSQSSDIFSFLFFSQTKLTKFTRNIVFVFGDFG